MAITATTTLAANSAANLAGLIQEMLDLEAGWQPEGPPLYWPGNPDGEYVRFMIQGTPDVAILNTLEGVTAAAAELNLTDGATSANAVPGKTAVLDAAGALRTAENVGTAATGFTAVEYGDGYNHVTVLTVDTTLPAIAGGAALGVGVLGYTFPAGAILVNASRMALAIQQTEANITADTPEIGLGTVIASGAVAVLSGTPKFEDILTGQVAADCNGAATEAAAIPTAAVPLVIAAADAHTVHVNVADAWAAGGDAAAELTGTVVLVWQFLG